MVKEKLIIEGVDIPIDKGISTVLTFSIKDIQQPDKVKSSFSKTIKLPGSKAINDKLNFIFEVNSDSTFNPNLKLDATYFQNDIAVFSGFIQLKDIHKKDYNQVEYSVVLFGETANIFRELGNKFLNDAGMNWQELDHDYTRAIQENSWDTSYILNGVVTPFALGSGYVYPMINYGNDTDIDRYDVTEMFPAVYAKEYIDRMFLDAGYTYSSNFFNASLFKHLIIPFNGKEFNPTETDLSPRRVQANVPLYVDTGTDNFSIDTSSTQNGDESVKKVRMTNSVLDANSQYNTTTGTLTVGATGYYRITFEIFLQAEVTPQSGTALPTDVVVNGNSRFKNDFTIQVNGTTVNTNAAYIFANNLTPAVTYQTANPSTYPDANFTTPANPHNFNPPNRYLVSVDLNLDTGDTVQLYNTQSWTWNQFTSETSNPFPYYERFTTIGYDATFKSILLGGSISLEVLDRPYVENDSIEMVAAIPDKVKQRDFLTSIIKMFNLYMIPDENNPKNIIIEPREDFYTTDIIDWSQKLDYSQEHTLTPTGVTNKQRYIYTYKKDTDYYNKKYENSWLDIYGVRNVYLENDFNKTDHKTELIFSPTPMVGQLTNDRVVSTIIDVDQTLQQKTIKSNIRILYYSGLKNTVVNWEHTSSFGFANLKSVYPYAAHFNDPFTPTIDINFGLPREIYYDNTYGSITITNNNLYNAYHRKELEQLTDKDSKIFKGYFLLNPTDIINLSFRPTYFFDNEYWTLHKVMYASSEYKPSKCEFLKLKAVPTPTVITEEIIGVGRSFIGDEETPKMFQDVLSGDNILNMKSSHADGLDNFIDKTAMFVDIKGDNNKVFTGSKNITIQGDNNVIESNLENITLINTNNVTVTESNVTYVNGQKKGGDGVLLVTSGTYSQDLSIVGYEADCTSGIVTINLLEGLYEGYEQTFKKIAGDNDLVIDARFISGLVESDDSIRITKINDSVTLYYNGLDYNIK